MSPRKVVVIELNEVTWDLIDPLIAQGKLPTFEWLKANGTWGAPLSVDLPPQLDPWVTWTTLYTGRTQKEHNVYFLEQPPESIHAKRLWEICNEAGLKVGVYGSVCSWPPQPLNGFFVPETFARDSRTYPEELHYIQDLNLTYTRSIRLPADHDTLAFKLTLGRKLLGLGLGPREIATVAGQLLSERFDGNVRWKRVALQPLVNFAFFQKLYQRYRPDFCTFHTNHVAHYMHTYWMAMQPEAFRPLDVSAEEQRIHGKAIEHGYHTADVLLKRVLGMIDPKQTVLVVASSMGQKPYRSMIDGGKRIVQWRSLPLLLEMLGVKDRAHAVSTMSDEFCITAEQDGFREQIANSLRSTYVDRPDRPVFFLQVIGTTVRVNLIVYSAKEVNDDSQIHFQSPAGETLHRYGDLIYDTKQLKSGCHDPRGTVIFYGAGVQKGLQLGMYDNLDFAPTLLTMLGLSVPENLTGRVMEEVVEPRPRVSTTATR